MISIIHPTRSRPERSAKTFEKWVGNSPSHRFEWIVSLDIDDPLRCEYEKTYRELDYEENGTFISLNRNRSAIDAINNAAKIAKGDVIMIVSDDTEPCPAWYEYIYHEANGKVDWILKTKDGIQDYIITMPIMDRTYYNRTGYIYHPEFQHLFCDTYLTCVADITGRKITSNLMFKHDHYSVNGTEPDDLHKRNDATWKQGQETFIKLMKQFTPQERARIKDPGMRSWLRNHGV